MKRRDFLITCGAFASLQAIQFGSFAAGHKTMRRIWHLMDLNKSIFEKYLGENFTLTNESGEMLEMSLAHVDDADTRTQSNAPTIDSYSITFEMQSDRPFDQGMFTVTHPELGEFTAFGVSIITKNPKIRHYQFIFNQITE